MGGSLGESMTAEGAAAMAAILAEADEWQRIMALDGEVALVFRLI